MTTPDLAKYLIDSALHVFGPAVVAPGAAADVALGLALLADGERESCQHALARQRFGVNLPPALAQDVARLRYGAGFGETVRYEDAARLAGQSVAAVRKAIGAGRLKRVAPGQLAWHDVVRWAWGGGALPKSRRARAEMLLWRLLLVDVGVRPPATVPWDGAGLPPAAMPIPAALRQALAGCTLPELHLLAGHHLAWVQAQYAPMPEDRVYQWVCEYADFTGADAAGLLDALNPDPRVCVACHRYMRWCGQRDDQQMSIDEELRNDGPEDELSDHGYAAKQEARKAGSRQQTDDADDSADRDNGFERQYRCDKCGAVVTVTIASRAERASEIWQYIRALQEALRLPPDYWPESALHQPLTQREVAAYCRSYRWQVTTGRGLAARLSYAAVGQALGRHRVSSRRSCLAAQRKPRYVAAQYAVFAAWRALNTVNPAMRFGFPGVVAAAVDAAVPANPPWRRIPRRRASAAQDAAQV